MVAWRALDDEPLSADDWRYLDAGRLRPTVDTLTHHFRCWLGLVKEPGPGPMCVGLFGGLGQGKSTAVRAALDEARQSPPRLPQLLSRIFCGRAHHTFNVSQFTADDLEWRLMASVLLRRSLRNIGVLLGCLTLAFVVATLWLSRFHDVSLGAITFHGTKSALKWLLPDAIEGWLKGSMQSRTVGSLMVWTLVTAALGYLFGRLLTQPFHQRARDVVVMGLARMTFAVPRILIVDDLDRADVRQQRAFLRALHRWSTTDHLLWGVVVCMDDSALMTSPAAPESPESLILKCLQLVLRLPDRQREDVVVLVLSCSELARRRNPDFAPLLCNVQWLASLVRVLLASAKPSAIGPRLVKHMVNDVMVQCHG